MRTYYNPSQDDQLKDDLDYRNKKEKKLKSKESSKNDESNDDQEDFYD